LPLCGFWSMWYVSFNWLLCLIKPGQCGAPQGWERALNALQTAQLRPAKKNAQHGPALLREGS
jgi:hypothetical protein